MSRTTIPKVSQVKTVVEPIFYTLFMQLAERNGKSVGAYLRGMLIEELKAKGLVTNEMLADMVSGHNPVAKS